MKINSELSSPRIGLSNCRIYSEQNKASPSKKKISSSKGCHPLSALYHMILKIKTFATAVILKPFNYIVGKLKNVKKINHKKIATDKNISSVQNIYSKPQTLPIQPQNHETQLVQQQQTPEAQAALQQPQLPETQAEPQAPQQPETQVKASQPQISETQTESQQTQTPETQTEQPEPKQIPKLDDEKKRSFSQLPKIKKVQEEPPLRPKLNDDDQLLKVRPKSKDVPISPRKAKFENNTQNKTPDSEAADDAKPIPIPVSISLDKDGLVSGEEVMKLFPKNNDKLAIKSTKQGLEKAFNVRTSINQRKLEVDDSTLLNQMGKVCEIAYTLKEKIGPLLSEKQQIFHLGSKSSGLPASFELHRKNDGTIETLIKLKFLGGGISKKVSSTLVFETEMPLARGKAKLVDEKAWKIAKNEEMILNLVKGIPHVLQAEDIVYSKVGDKNHQIIYMEQGKMDLFDYMDKIIPLKEKKQLALALVQGMSEIHKRNIVHRDMKTLNILMIPDRHNPQEMQLKIMDFGSAIHAVFGSEEWDEMQKESHGTSVYFSPEMWKVELQDNNPGNPPITSQTDDWAVGCILWELFTRNRTPWMDKILNPKNKPIIKEIVKELSADDNLPKPEAGTLREIAWKMLRPNLKDRMTCQQAFEALKTMKNIKV